MKLNPKQYCIVDLSAEIYRYFLTAYLENKKDKAIESIADLYQKEGRFKIELFQKFIPMKVCYEMKKGPDFLRYVLFSQDIGDLRKIFIVFGGQKEKEMISFLEDFVEISGFECTDTPPGLDQYLKNRFKQNPKPHTTPNMEAARKAVEQSRYFFRPSD